MIDTGHTSPLFETIYFPTAPLCLLADIDSICLLHILHGEAYRSCQPEYSTARPINKNKRMFTITYCISPLLLPWR